LTRIRSPSHSYSLQEGALLSSDSATQFSPSHFNDQSGHEAQTRLPHAATIPSVLHSFTRDPDRRRDRRGDAAWYQAWNSSARTS
ncbi:hypothetical protein PENTCL1PPCAC_19909, partial [Pristionchus entomophagus]